MAYKASEIPTAYPDSDAPIFGVHDSSTERRQAQKKRAQKLYQQQLIMAAERRKAEIAQCGKKHRKEVDMLRKTKAEYACAFIFFVRSYLLSSVIVIVHFYLRLSSHSTQIYRTIYIFFCFICC